MLPADARAEFLSGVTFNERGITSFPVDVLEDNLTALQAYRFLSYFGMESGTVQLDGLKIDTALDQVVLSRASLDPGSSPINAMTSNQHELRDFLMGYRCAGEGTCSQSDGNACTSNC